MLLAAAFVLTACSDKPAKSESSGVSDTDSSYYGVHFSDTGESLSTSSTHIDHSSQTSSDKNTESAATAQSIPSNSSSRTSSGSNSDTQSRTSSTHTTITYYYTDDTGEHSTETDTVLDVSSEPTAPSSSMNESDTSSDSSTDTETDPDSDETDTAPAGSFEEDDLTISFDGASIAYGQSMSDIISAIGEPLSTSEIPNEANPELPLKVYNYDYFYIEAAPDDISGDYIAVSMEIFDNSLKTQKGVHVGMTVQEAVAVYGSDMMIVGDDYRYYIGGNYLYLYIQNDIVANIGFGFDADVAQE